MEAQVQAPPMMTQGHPPMDIIPFEKHKITTMTLVMTLTNSVLIDYAFHLLPITRIDLPPIKGNKKCKLPHCKVPGSILSMRYKNHARGVILRQTSFKNAITIDISTVEKNVSLKLSPLSIQNCGASSKANGEEAANHVLNYLNRIQYMLAKIQRHPTKYQEELDWILTQTRGKEFISESMELQHSVNCPLRVYTTTTQHEIKPVTEQVPKHLDREVVCFFGIYCEGFVNHHDYCMKLEFIRSITNIVDGHVQLRTVNEAMVNYNYSLGFEIDRTRLNELIDGVNGFVSRYNNELSTCVTVELPYEPPPGLAIKRRKSKVQHHTFLCYRSGSITQSGPNDATMKEVYYLFMNTIASLLPHIKYDGSRYSPDNRSQSVSSSSGYY